MKWIEICIESNTDNTEEASAALIEAGAGGAQIQNPEEIKSLIDQAGAKELADYRDFSSLLQKYRTTAYFPANINFEKLKGALKKTFPESKVLVKEVDDSTWEGNWKKYYTSFCLTDKFQVVPSWEVEDKSAENEIIIDPGMAFGTGLHESTKLCSVMLEKRISAGDSFLDIGTGTGILSILASKYGAKNVVAFDIDEVAVKTAKENMRINSVEEAIVFKGELDQLETYLKKINFRAPFKFDMVAANIISDVIIGMAGKIKDVCKEGGVLICSGIIIERENDVIKALENAGFTISEIKRENEWTAISANA